jgi:UDP-N-acetylmuramoyl-tripeptide--D-alanyl-D-alanine ligase
MKKASVKFLEIILKRLAKSTLEKYKPQVVGITGSVGKSSTKEAVYAVLKNKKRVRANQGNLNNELGLPLTILGDYDYYKEDSGNKIGFWFKVIVSGVGGLITRKTDYPEVLILEYGANKPGDIEYLLKIAKPDIGIITAISDVPVHVEFYNSPEAVGREKSRLIAALGAKGTAILNYDDDVVLQMKEKTRGKIITFGFKEGADIRAINFENQSEGTRPIGLSFKMEHNGSAVPVRMANIFGRSHVYNSLAAAAVGIANNMNLVEIASALMLYRPLAGRMRLIKGEKESWIIDDTYNAAPTSTEEALEALQSLPAKRKIAILGDMAQLGEYSVASHEAIGKKAASVADIIVTVGAKARFIAESGRKKGFIKDNIYSFDNSDDAKAIVEKIIEEGDLILIKGSQVTRMEKIVLEIMAEPKKAKDLLVRQYGRWLGEYYIDM